MIKEKKVFKKTDGWLKFFSAPDDLFKKSFIKSNYYKKITL